MPPSVEQVAIVAGWLASFVFAALGVPWLVGKRQQKMLATKDHPLRVAYAGVVREDILPLMLADTRAAITDAVKAIKFPEPDLSKLQLTIPDAEIRATVMDALREYEANRNKMVEVRAGKHTTEGPQMIQQATSDPQGAKVLARAIQGLDFMAKQKLITKADAKEYQGALKGAFAEGGMDGLRELASGYGIPAEYLDGLSGGGVGVPSVALKSKGGGFNPG